MFNGLWFKAECSTFRRLVLGSWGAPILGSVSIPREEKGKPALQNSARASIRRPSRASSVCVRHPTELVKA